MPTGNRLRSVRLGDVAGQASTLNQLGILYDDDFGRTEEAVAFLRQAADKYVEIRNAASEGVARSNLAIRLRKLRRLDERGRKSVRRSSASSLSATRLSRGRPAILADIETDAGNPAAAAEAQRKAIACYLAYRRDGGENHSGRWPFSLRRDPVLACRQTSRGSITPPKRGRRLRS